MPVLRQEVKVPFHLSNGSMNAADLSPRGPGKSVADTVDEPLGLVGVWVNGWHISLEASGF